MHSKTHTTFSFSIIVLILFFFNPTSCDPQTNLLETECSLLQDILYDPVFMDTIRQLSANLNATLSDLRSQIVDSVRFAIASRTSVFALFQCRDYLSTSDCLSCFSSAASVVHRDCFNASSFIVIYDGCYLRYRNDNFFQQATQNGDAGLLAAHGLCDNRTVADKNDFNRTADALLTDLVAATPRIKGFFAAAKRGATGGAIVYGVAQCAHTVSKSSCQQCLETAYANIGSCPPGADARSIDVGCFLRYSDTAFFSDNNITDLEAVLRSKGGKRKKVIIAVVVVVAVLGVAASLLLLLLRRWKKTKMPWEVEMIGESELHVPVNFHYQALKSATKNFSEENKLGEGGFGEVYLGVMQNGKRVAVKKLAIGKSRQIQTDFEKEVTLINNVHHRNLIRLLGCCSKGPEYILVYEYMANSSLDKYLFGEKRGTLCWRQRFDIIVGIARGLAYLHEEFHVCIIHRDIKSNNILLDDEFQPKIADFGLARLLPADQSHLNTRFAGTLGYMAPEYAVLGKLSEKVDVYSYGMVVLEIVSGRKSNEIRLEPTTEYLLNWAWRLYEKGSLMELVDETLDPHEYEIDEVKKVIEIALVCTQSADCRPAMSEAVVWLLSKDEMRFTLTQPNWIKSTNATRDTSTSSSSFSSHPTTSISRMSAR